MSNEPDDGAPADHAAGAEDLINERYRVEGVLGRGASGTTYVAADVVAGRRVALKALDARAIETWKEHELFEREARVLGGLRHHGVPELYDFFERTGPQGPQMCLVMELVEGVSLARRIAEGPRFDPIEVMQLGSDLLDVLIHLHGRAPPVYHRDIKPSNIIVRADGTPVLIDFGGVCDGWRAPGESGDTIVGTAGYMPPEQYLGQVGPWSDLYALGATLLHLLTGRPPAEHDFGAGRHMLPAELEVHPRLRRFVDAVLAPAPRDRPQSAAEARRLLMEDAPAASPAATEAAIALGGAQGGARALIDPGPPPRDPTGPHAALYKEMRGKYSHPAGCLFHLVMIALTITWLALENPLAAVATVLSWIGLGKLLGHYERTTDRALPPDGTPGGKLFVHGSYAVAEVFAREETDKGFKLKYHYRADGSTLEDAVEVSTLVGLANPPGTRFGVIWSPEAKAKHHVIKQDLADPK